MTQTGALRKKHTVILSSHILSEIENICDRIAIIDEGKIISVFGIEEIKYKNKSLEEEYFNKTEKFENREDNDENN